MDVMVLSARSRRNPQGKQVTSLYLTMTTTPALSILVRIPTDAPGYDWDQWELDGKTIPQSELFFTGNCVCYQGRCFVDDGSMIEFEEWLF